MKARLCTVLCGLSIAYTASASELFVNGNFGTGDLTGWTMTTNPAPGPVGFYVTSATTTPNNGFPTVGADAPSTFYAVTDNQGPGDVAISQSFTVPVGTTSAILSFATFVNDIFGGSGTGGSIVLLAPQGRIH